jgi:hypothetical protein
MPSWMEVEIWRIQPDPRLAVMIDEGDARHTPDTRDEGRKVGLIPHGSARTPLG